MSYPKRLIEVDLPIKRISEHARREKSIRHGHISTLHIWWARRPLGACRAVLCAALWPDPADILCPEDFRDIARKWMLRWAQNHIVLLKGQTLSRFLNLQRNPEKINDNFELRNALLDFIAEFSNWDNSDKLEFIETSQALTHGAHLATANGNTKPLVFDPFSGGGSIPIEALRIGAEAFATDLNPVAVLLNKVGLEYIPKFGTELAEKVKEWGSWIKERAEKELATFYPRDPDGSMPIAFVWARTIISEAPDDGDGIPIEVPLMRSFWLAKKNSGSAALRWVRGKDGKVKTEIIEKTYADGTTCRVKRPLMEIFEPRTEKEVDPGTVARGSATCPVTGYTTPIARVREQLKARLGGTNDARLIAIRCGNRRYRLPFEQDFEAIKKVQARFNELENQCINGLSIFPDEPTPTNQGHRAVGSPWIYGMRRWRDLFTSRQLISITTFIRLVQEVESKVKGLYEPEFCVAIITMLGIATSRLTDFTSSLCRLNYTGGRGVANTFGRQALQMVWDFAESNPINIIAANWQACINAAYDTVMHESVITNHGQAIQCNATQHVLPDDSAHAFITDPPYYDAVPYADLADYFYVWIRRSLGYHNKDLFVKNQTPKDEQAVVIHPNSSEERIDFEDKMTKAMSEGRRILTQDGIGIVVFAHKSTTGWETQLQSMINAGWIITGSWPIDTERGGRVNAQNTASLASSVHLVCRPREDIDGKVDFDKTGDWRDVLQELPKRISEWMPRLAQEGVVGADAIFSCLGPALEVFSRFSRVEKASGEQVTLNEYLEHVWATVAREALNMIFEGADTTGFEENSRLTAMWLWTISTADGKEDLDSKVITSLNDNDDNEGESSNHVKSKKSGYLLEYDTARKIAQGLGVHLEKMGSLVELKGEVVRLLPVNERATYLFGREEQTPPPKGKRQGVQLNLFSEIYEDGETTGVEKTLLFEIGDTVLDRLHQSMILFATERSEALRRLLIEDGVGRDQRFWRLAQSLSALYPGNSDEKRWVDGVLAKKKGLGF